MKKLKLDINIRVISDNGYYLLERRDGPLLTPAGNPYRVPTKALAEKIAEEWRAQKEKIIPATMPLTKLAATAIDLVAKRRDEFVDRLIAYSAAELLCHRAAQPAGLASKQEEIWQPFLDWCAVKYDALLQVGIGVMPIIQSAEAVTALRKAIEACDDFMLAGLGSAVEASGSLVLGLALAENEYDAAEILKASELDYEHQAMQWGRDPVMTSRLKSIRNDLELCEKWFKLLRS